jgi:hypothetical protein
MGEKAKKGKKTTYPCSVTPGSNAKERCENASDSIETLSVKDAVSWRISVSWPGKDLAA